MHRRRVTYCLAFVLLAIGCSEAKPVARTVNDVARELCAIFFSERQGISVEDAARGICSTREVLDPFIREVLKAQRAAGMQATAGAQDGGRP
jgi:hypothetical protein